jgi:YVTN family beta-propeller protein
MKKFPASHLAAYALLALPASTWAAAPEQEKLYVAIEGEGKIAVFDTATRTLLRQIDLADGTRAVAPHNVQVAPDGKSVWITANSAHGGHGAKPKEADEHDSHHEAEAGETPADAVLVIDPETDTVTQRIAIGPSLHLAHVVLTPDSATAYVTAQNESAVYQLDARHYTVTGKIPAPGGSQPHGLRIAPDGAKGYVALLQGRGIGVLDTASGKLEAVPVEGAAVQTAVTADGKFALASLYDSKKLAVYDTASKTLHYIELPKSARGPLQLYPAPDSRTVYVADQGHYFGQPDGHLVFKVDLAQSRPAWPINAGAAPHGIVVAKDGLHAYVSNLASDDLSIIDLKTGMETARLPVGKEPNGISLWNRLSGGTP